MKLIAHKKNISQESKYSYKNIYLKHKNGLAITQINFKIQPTEYLGVK